ncbi:MAG: InlB B-repeat-containing protein, partial [Oscillospiraceae bacterium]|nr:InlB B-repeat-containing protein [Oscillospiraceae bacterium]
IYNHVITLPENGVSGRTKWQGQNAGDKTYMSSNHDEFFASVTSIWFNAMGEGNWSTNGYGRVNTREELRRYDPIYYNFCARVLPETKDLSAAWANASPQNQTPVYAPEPGEPTGRWGPSVKIISNMSIANNPSGSGIQTYIPFNAATNHTPNVELWWDYNTDNMRWYIEPVDTSEQYFRIVRKYRRDYTQNAHRDDLVLTASGGTAGANVTLTQRSNTDQTQQWQFNRQSDGTFVIVNRQHPTMAITTTSNGTSSGTRIAMGSATTATSRFWKLEGASTPLPIMSDTPVTPTPSISLNPMGTYTFAGATVGYATAPAAQTFTVARTSANVATGAMTVALSGANASAFTLSATSLNSIGATSTNTRTFTVRPNTGLAAGTYTATVTVSGTGMTSQTANVSFTVTALEVQEVTVTFDLNYPDSTSLVTVIANATGNILLSQVPTAEREGFTFEGWFTESAGGVQVNVAETVFGVGNTVIYAQWTESSLTNCDVCNSNPCECPSVVILHLYISAVNTDGNAWIEVTNPTGDDMSARGLYLSNDEDDYCLWRMPAVIVRAGETVRINAADNDSGDVLKWLQVNFNIEVGETIRLSYIDGNVLSLFEVV